MSKEETMLILTLLTDAYRNNDKLTIDEKSMLVNIIDKLVKEL